MKSVVRIWRQDPLAAVSLGILVLIAIVAILADRLAPYDPLLQSAELRFLAPSANHLLGTDHLGRDVLSRVIAGSRVSVLVGVAATTLGAAVGALVGVTTGYWAGSGYDSTLQRVVDTFMAPPSLVVAIMFVAIAGRGETQVILAIALVMAPRVARVTRGVAIGLREESYVLAAKLAGSGAGRTMWRHIVPGVVPTLTVLVTIGLGQAIMIAAFLSFLGYGVPPPAPTWGGMLSVESRPYFERAPWMAIAPGIALGITVMAANLAGDGFRPSAASRASRHTGKSLEGRLM